MQIFLPYANPIKTAKVLDNKRLNKQILECCQILAVITNINIGWKIPKYVKNHPTTLMWKNYSDYLLYYITTMLNEYVDRNNKTHACEKIICKYFINKHFLTSYNHRQKIINHLTTDFCRKHQELLLIKNFDHYKKYFGEKI